MDQFFIFCASDLYLLCFVVAAIYFLRLPRATQIKLASFGLCVALLSYAVALVAGAVYFDPRPFVEGHFTPLIAHDTENGFPSDHVLLVSCVAAVVSFFSKRVSIILWMLTLLIAYARVYVGVHHVLDVTGSMLITTVVSFLVYLLFFSRYIVPISSKLEKRFFHAIRR